MNNLRFLVVDAFTVNPDEPYSGNPAAVVWLDEGDFLTDQQRLKLSREFNLSETAFVQPRMKKQSSVSAGEVILNEEVRSSEINFDLRWFTPLKEVELCGHATLAACRALSEWGEWDFLTPVRFQTKRQGTLSGTKDGAEFILDFPQILSNTVEIPATASAALGGCVITSASSSRHSLVLMLEDAEQVERLVPDSTLLKSLHRHGVCVTALSSTPNIDFVSRFFAPNYGIDEDPVCGSAHCVLGPLWRQRLKKANLSAQQLSARGGALRVECPGGDPRLRLRGFTAVAFVGSCRRPQLQGPHSAAP